MSGTLHVIGAGLAGLAAAIAGIRAGWRVALHEAAPQAGGRCRSFRCERLDRVIDNGTHLLLGANRNALAFAAGIGGTEALERAEPAFPFLDLASGRHWTVSGRAWKAGLGETLAALGFPWVPERETVAMRLGPARSFTTLWEPLCVAALNTPPADASARLFATLARALLLGGNEALRPWIAPAGLSAAFAGPAVATLAAHGADLRFGRRLVGLADNALVFDDTTIRVGRDDRAVLALPPWALEGVVAVPAFATRAIVNVHFRLPASAALPGGQPFLGLVGGTAQWLALRDDVLSTTVSAADRLAERPPDEIAERLWQEVAPALGLDPRHCPRARVIKERRATLAHTPDAVRRRPGPATKLAWLFLAGDWLAGRWPCTIEAAVASGLAATRLAVGRDDLQFA